VPIPPLDGSKILFLILGGKAIGFQRALEQYGFMILIFFLLFGGIRIIFPIIHFMYSVIVGKFGVLF
jgi:Zn-dependent protease